MLDSLITSKTRVKLLLKFFANPDTTAYLRSLAEEFGESTNAIRVELNRLANAGLLSSREDGRTKVYQANLKHPLFFEIQSMVRKFLGIDQLTTIIFEKVSSLGQLEQVYLVGDYAKGLDSRHIDVVLIGMIDKVVLAQLIGKAEAVVKRQINATVFSNDSAFQNSDEAVLIWNKNHQ